MVDKKSLGIGVIGAGTIGGAVIQLLLERSDLLRERSNITLELKCASDLSLERLGKLGVIPERQTTDWREVISDPDVDIVVELVGGTKVAYDIVDAALAGGKQVVTANKALLAERGKDLFAQARKNNLALRFEAAVAGAIPIIRSIRDGLVATNIRSLLGIVNGTCNYVLTQMLLKGEDYSAALQKAQELGYAEADPTFDVEGFDSAHKLFLLASLGFATTVEFKQIPVQGISKLSLSDVKLAQEMGYVSKLLSVARAQEDTLFLSVHPALLPHDHPLANINGSMNAISIETDVAGPSIFCGLGAGDTPTASAVLSDVVDIARTLGLGANSYNWTPAENNRYTLSAAENYECCYFLRFTVNDCFGVLGKIASIMGKNQISISSVVQKPQEDNKANIVMLTHKAREGNVNQSLAEITGMDFNAAAPGVLRIEG